MTTNKRSETIKKDATTSDTDIILDIEDIDKDNQIDLARKLVSELIDEDSWPHDPMIRVDLSTGKISLTSDLIAYDDMEWPLMSANDFLDWIDLQAEPYTEDDQFQFLYEWLFDYAKRAFSDAEVE